MRANILFFFFAAILVAFSCTSAPPPKLTPAYVGQDPKVKDFVQDYMDLAAEAHLKFDKNVTIGFTDIDEKSDIGEAIGLCTYGLNWREIDFDTKFWNKATFSTKKMLIFHELTHCYCGRDHDFGASKPYRTLVVWTSSKENESLGFFEDGCPLSMMHPVIMTDSCSWAHHEHYLKEMFDRCEPW